MAEERFEFVWSLGSIKKESGNITRRVLFFVTFPNSKRSTDIMCRVVSYDSCYLPPKTMTGHSEAPS